MMTFEQSIAGLFSKELITEQSAISYASRRSVVGRAIDAIRSSRGEKTTAIEDLTLDADYGKNDKS